jgi:hypothetical protein
MRVSLWRKKRIAYFFCFLIIIVVLIVIARLFGATDRDAKALGQMFYQPQWKSFDFSKRISSMNIAPSLSGTSYDEIIAASVDAGIVSPILPQDAIENAPDGAKYYYAVFQENLSEKHTYEARFFALADERDPDRIFSIWVSALPLERDGQNGLRRAEKEFIFSVNDTPQMIRDCMSDYFSER